MYILEGALFHDVISICDPSFKTRIEFNDLVTLLCKQICSGLATFPASTVDGDGSVAWYGGKCFLNKVWLQDIDVDGIGICPSANSFAVRTSRRTTEESAMMRSYASTETLLKAGL